LHDAAEHVHHVVVAIGAGKNNYAEFHVLSVWSSANTFTNGLSLKSAKVRN